MPRRPFQQKTYTRPLVYRLVFGVMYTKWLVAVMFGFFLLHPAVPLFAAEEEVAETAATTEASEVHAAETSTPETTEANEVVATEVVESEAPVSKDDDAPLLFEPIAPEAETVVVDELDPSGPAPQVEEVLTVEPVSEVDTSVGEEVIDETLSASSTPDETGTTTDTLPEPTEASEPAASTTEPIAEVAPAPVESVTNEQPATEVETLSEATGVVDAATTSQQEIIYIYDKAVDDTNRHSFGVNECVSVGGGSYYCHEANGNEAVSTDNEVYAAPDAEGDHEIYLRLDGEVKQITHNNYDDRAPYYDAPVEQIVFHRLLDGRYQIFNYDVETERESQLTNTPENSMEPTQGDGVTVWQEWVGDNWEIAALIDGEIKLLSQSVHNDVAPAVKDGYVMWHTMDSSGQKLLSVYEIKTGQTSLVSDPEGGQVSNPRFVLVYDTTFNNGDTVTKTYDPETGAIEPIASNPWRDKPVIPDPEPGGEAGAIINIKPTTRDADSEGNDLPGTGPEPQPEEGTATSTDSVNDNASSTNAFDIDLSATSSEPLPLTEFDLIVEPYVSSSSAQSSNSATRSGDVE